MTLALEDQDSVCQRPGSPLHFFYLSLPEEGGVNTDECICSESLGAPFPQDEDGMRSSQSAPGFNGGSRLPCGPKDSKAKSHQIEGRKRI